MINKLPSNVAEQLVLTDPIALSYIRHQPRNYRSKYKLRALDLRCTIRTKQRYHDKTRTTESIDLRNFNDYTYVLADSANYSHAISQIANDHNNSALALFAKSSGTLQAFLDTIVPILDALGIPYIRTSSYIAPDRVTSVRNGIYYLQYSPSMHTFSSATKANQSASYTYVPLSGYDVIPEYAPYVELYRHFYANIKRPFELVGVQQKYLTDAAVSPNFTLLDDTFINTLRTAAPYIISVKCTDSPYCEFASAALPDNVPSICKLHQEEIQRFNALYATLQYRVKECQPLFDHFNIPYEFTTTTVTATQLKAYPLYRNFNNASDFHYYLQLEYFRELHSDSLSEHSPIHHT